MPTVRTLGHGNLPADDFARVAAGAGVAVIVDVRRQPASRRHPQYGRDELAVWLPRKGFSYRWVPALGGRRTPSPGSPNVALEDEHLRAYADHMATGEFAAGVAEVVAVAEEAPAAVVCAEGAWWHCHRRLLADHLVLVCGAAVEHLSHDGHLAPHQPAPEARVDGDHLVYDVVPQGRLFALD